MKIIEGHPNDKNKDYLFRTHYSKEVSYHHLYFGRDSKVSHRNRNPGHQRACPNQLVAGKIGVALGLNSAWGL